MKPTNAGSWIYLEKTEWIYSRDAGMNGVLGC